MFNTKICGIVSFATSIGGGLSAFMIFKGAGYLKALACGGFITIALVLIMSCILYKISTADLPDTKDQDRYRIKQIAIGSFLSMSGFITFVMRGKLPVLLSGILFGLMTFYHVMKKQ